MDNSEEALIERIRRRDPAALADFIENRRLQLLAYIHGRLSDALRARIDAEDVLQETSAECLRLLPSAELENWDPFSWLCQNAERRIIDAHRRLIGAKKRSAEKETPLAAPGGDGRGGLIDLLAASLTSPSAAFSRDQREAALQQALAELPEEARQALRMRYVENLPTKEIAQRLNKSHGSLRVLLSRTLTKLEEALGPDAKPWR